MKYRRLFVLVEGPDDVRFFERIVKPEFERRYNSVEVRPYANLERKKIAGFIRSIQAMGAEYLYIADINDAPCITAKKQDMQEGIKHLQKDRLLITRKEIEGWYLAGIDRKSAQQLKLRPLDTTDELTKEQFNRLISQRGSRIDFMIEMLKHFSIELAKRRNTSFKYFWEEYVVAS